MSATQQEMISDLLTTIRGGDSSSHIIEDEKSSKANSGARSKVKPTNSVTLEGEFDRQFDDDENSFDANDFVAAESDERLAVAMTASIQQQDKKTMQLIRDLEAQGFTNEQAQFALKNIDRPDINAALDFLLVTQVNLI